MLRPCRQYCLRGVHRGPHLYFLPTICPMRPSHLPFWCLVLQAVAGVPGKEASLYTAFHAATSSSSLHTGGRCMRMARQKRACRRQEQDADEDGAHTPRKMLLVF